MQYLLSLRLLLIELLPFFKFQFVLRYSKYGREVTSPILCIVSVYVSSLV